MAWTNDKLLGHGQQLREIISIFNMAVRSYGDKIRVCVLCDLELRDMTLIQGHDTPFSNR